MKLFGQPDSFQGKNMIEFHKQYSESSTIFAKGAYGEVRTATDVHGNEFAVKTLQKGRTKVSDIYNECDIMQSLNHANIVKFYDLFEDNKVCKVVMQKAKGVDLYEYLMGNDHHASEQSARTIIRQLTEALKYCHDQGVVHRDIKPENILLGENNSLKQVLLIDFGLSVKLGEEDKTKKCLDAPYGSMSYVAPEILSEKKYDYKCDIWSLGLIAYILCSGGYHPYLQGPKGTWTFGPEDAWQGVSEEAKDFIRRCLTKDPESRYDYDQLLQHEWIAAVDTDCFEPELNADQLRTNFRSYARKNCLESLKTDQCVAEKLRKNSWKPLRFI